MGYLHGLRIAPVLTLAAWSAAIPMAQAADGPVFQLSFTNGLTPEVGPNKPGRWTGKNAPQFHPHGLDGPALLVGDVDGNQQCPALSFDALPGTQDRGTMLFWVRGLKHWDLYRTVYDRPPGPSQNIASGGGTMWRWNYDTFGVKLYAGTPGHDYRQMVYPRFDPYRWTQLGYTWQNGHVCLYLNGELVNENAQFGLGFGAFSLGGGAAYEGSLRLYDKLKIWDRALDKAQIKRLYRQDFQQATRPLVTSQPVPSAIGASSGSGALAGSGEPPPPSARMPGKTSPR